MELEQLDFISQYALQASESLSQGGAWLDGNLPIEGIGIAVLILLVLLGAPLYIIFSAAALFAFYVSEDLMLAGIIIEIQEILKQNTLIALPLFTFAGYLMAESKSPARLISVAKSCLSWLPGGAAIVCIVTCAFFTAFTGASGVTIIALGGLVMPTLLKEGYREKFALGLVTSCGSLGLLWFPSLPIIIYGTVGETSIDQLFLAGVIPGIILITILSLYSIFRKKKNLELAERSKIQDKEEPRLPVLRSLWNAKFELMLPFIIGFSVFGGFMTASQASALTAVYVLVVETFIHKDIRFFKDVPRIAKESMVLISSILIILVAATAFTGYLKDADVANNMIALIQQYIDPNDKILFLIALNIFLLIVGCMMDIFSAIIIIVPIIKPLAMSFGVDPVHLGIIFLTNLEIGYLTPPVGINLFISSVRFKKPVTTLYAAALPFLALLLIALLIITYVPELSLYLPSLFSK